jgi:hypothetical protein
MKLFLMTIFTATLCWPDLVTEAAQPIPQKPPPPQMGAPCTVLIDWEEGTCNPPDLKIHGHSPTKHHRWFAMSWRR